MGTTELPTAQTTEVAMRVAVLRGLYGDIAENLHDPAACAELWAQIEAEQARLESLIPHLAEAV